MYCLPLNHTTKSWTFPDPKYMQTTNIILLKLRKISFIGMKTLWKKGEKNAGYQHFLHFPQCFQNAPCPAWFKSRFSFKGLNFFKKRNDLHCLNKMFCSVKRV